MKHRKLIPLEPPREDLSPEAKAALVTCVIILAALLLGALYFRAKANNDEDDGEARARMGSYEQYYAKVWYKR